MVDISIIMPVYNTGEVLNRTVKSVMAQTFSNFELIIIDDGSDLFTQNICKELELKYSNILVLREENNGLCAARNKGVEIANGRYIAFIDHDDEFLPKLLEDNYKLLIANNADFIKFGYKIKNMDRSPSVVRHNGMKNGVYNRAVLPTMYPDFKDDGLLMYVWDGIYNKDFLKNNNIKFMERFKYGQEDTCFCMDAYMCANKIVYNNQKYYVHYRYDGSTSRTLKKSRLYTLIHDLDYVESREVTLYTDFVCKGLETQYIEKIRIRYIEVILISVFKYRHLLNEKEKKSFVKYAIKKKDKMGSMYSGRIYIVDVLTYIILRKHFMKLIISIL